MTRHLAGPPRAEPPIPAAIQELASGRSATAVWANELGGITWALGDDRYVKWQPLDTPIDLAAEEERLAWLAPHVAVPRVIGRGEDRDGRWLVTAALGGTTAVADRWRSDPRPVVDAIATGLRRFHDAVPVDDCPFEWPLRCDDIEGPPVDRLVVCHGDACAPNTLVDDDGAFVAHVDLGQCGVADRWADLAIASWSLEWNFGPGWDGQFYAAYGVRPDPERIAHHRMLWDR